MPRPDDLNSVGLIAAARALGLSRQALYLWIKSGKAKAYPMPSKLGPTGKPSLRIMRSDLDRLLRARPKRG